MVGERKGLVRNCERLLERKSLVFEAEYKFGYRNDGMRIVELYRTQLSEILEIVAVLFLVALYYILYGRTYKEVLLAQTRSSLG